LVVVGSGAFRGDTVATESYFISPTIVRGGPGGTPTFTNPGGFGGNWAGDSGYTGGQGGTGSFGSNGAGNGGSAATFSGNGAAGTNQMSGPTTIAFGAAGTAVSLRGISGSANNITKRPGRFGAGAGGDQTGTDNQGSGGSGGVWIDWTPASSFPNLGI
jgi:hypothetical protein